MDPEKVTVYGVRSDKMAVSVLSPAAESFPENMKLLSGNF
jgi:hypothetical protein